MKLTLALTVVLGCVGTGTAFGQHDDAKPPLAAPYPARVYRPEVQWVPYKLDSVEYVPPQPRPIWEPVRRLRWWIRYRPGYQVPRYVPVEGGQ